MTNPELTQYRMFGHFHSGHMSPTIKAAWVAALRSGLYDPGTGRLYDGQCYCALGVLCELHRLAHGGEWKFQRISDPETRKKAVAAGWNESQWHYLGSWQGLPKAVAVWAGLTRYDPLIMSTTVTALSDSRPVLEVARAVEGCL